MNRILTEPTVVFERPSDASAVEQCSQCGEWIIGGTSYFSGGKRYCPDCMFDGTGKFVDAVSIRVRFWGPVADTAKRIAAAKIGRKMMG